MPLHPAVVHAPLGLAVAIPLVLLVLTYLLFRGKASPRAFLTAALLQGIVVAGGLVALATGNADEDRVERVVSEAAIERHEGLATAFVVAAAIVFVVTLASSLLRERWSRRFAVLATAGSAAVLALGVAVGHAGGDLVYSHGAASAFASPGAARDIPHGDHD